MVQYWMSPYNAKKSILLIVYCFYCCLNCFQHLKVIHRFINGNTERMIYIFLPSNIYIHKVSQCIQHLKYLTRNKDRISYTNTSLISMCLYVIELHRVYDNGASITWWRHQMETFSALLALWVGNSPVPVNSPHKGQWRGALMFSLICAWIKDWVNNRETDDLRHHRGHYDVNVMSWGLPITITHNYLCLGVWIRWLMSEGKYFYTTTMLASNKSFKTYHAHIGECLETYTSSRLCYWMCNWICFIFTYLDEI